MNVLTFFANLINKALGLFHKVESVTEEIFHAADNFVNQFKKLEQSDIGQFLESGIEQAIPGSIAPINAVKLWIINASAKLANVEDTVHTDEGKIEAFLVYLANLKVSDATLYAGTLNTLNASLQKLLAGDGQHNLTTPMALVASAMVHDENLGTVV